MPSLREIMYLWLAIRATEWSGVRFVETHITPVPLACILTRFVCNEHNAQELSVRVPVRLYFVAQFISRFEQNFQCDVHIHFEDRL